MGILPPEPFLSCSACSFPIASLALFAATFWESLRQGPYGWPWYPGRLREVSYLFTSELVSSRCPLFEEMERRIDTQ